MRQPVEHPMAENSLKSGKVNLRSILIAVFVALLVVGNGYAQAPSGQGIPSAAPPASHSVNPAQPPGLNQNDPNVQVQEPGNAPNIFSGMMDPFDYDPRGRRDPFAQPQVDRPVTQGLIHGPLLPLQRFDLNQLRLTAILWDVHSPKAMLKDPEGHIYVVTPNTKIGPRNGYVAAIREGEIVVVETVDQDGRLVSTAQIVRIAR